MKKLFCMMILLIGFGFVSTAATFETPVFDLSAVSIDNVSIAALPIAVIANASQDIEMLDGWIPLETWNEGLDFESKLPDAKIAELLGISVSDTIVLSEEDYGGNELAHEYSDIETTNSGTIDCNDGGYIEYDIHEDADEVKTMVGWYQDGCGGQSGFSMIFTNKSQEFTIRE